MDGALCVLCGPHCTNQWDLLCGNKSSRCFPRTFLGICHSDIVKTPPPSQVQAKNWIIKCIGRSSKCVLWLSFRGLLVITAGVMSVCRPVLVSSIFSGWARHHPGSYFRLHLNWTLHWQDCSQISMSAAMLVVKGKVVTSALGYSWLFICCYWWHSIPSVVKTVERSLFTHSLICLNVMITP